jgi:hypothetical protein
MLILLHKLGIKPDLILFADTGSEKPETYEFLDIFNQWLVDKQMPEIIVVRKRIGNVSSTRKTLIHSKANLTFCLNPVVKGLLKDCLGLMQYLIFWVNVSNSQYLTLEEQCLISQSLPSKAYGNSTCSAVWKIQPQNEYVNNWALERGFIRKDGKKLVADYPIRKLIGYHAGEVRRLIDKKTNQMRSLTDGIYRSEYPLMVHGLDDLACRMLILSEGLSIPPKSSCFFCPNSKLPEIKSLEPELKARALLIEQTWRNGVQFRDDSSIKGLGRNFAWGDIDELSGIEEVAIASIQESRQCSCVD